MNKKVICIELALLFLGTSVIPSVAQETEQTTLPTLQDNWLYVGGSGPGNYSRIQDAIDNATDGDTIFVYRGVYYETLVIEKSILLIGEEKNETILDGINTSGYLVKINNTEGVTICSFTFNNLYNGISMVNADFSNITDCILRSSNTTNIDYGIYCETSKNIIIEKNHIVNFSLVGICLALCSHCLVTQNIILNCALYTYGTGMFNTYSYNTISNTTNAFVIDDCFSRIEGNTLRDNFGGMLLIEGFGNKIVRNNFISNSNYNAMIQTQYLIKTLLGLDKWERNYWDDSHGFIKFIPCHYIPNIYSPDIYLPYSLNIDWHPAQAPYDF